MTETNNHSGAGKMLQTDVVERRSTNDSKLSVFVTEFRVVVLVGIAIAIVASLFFTGAPAVAQIGVGLALGTVIAAILRIRRVI